MKLDQFTNQNFTRGRSAIVEAAWLITEALFVRSWLPGSAHRRALLRLFGASIGTGVVLKPGIRIKFPWRLKIGDHSWIGESVWIDNLADVEIGSNCCISQNAYLCTGSHDWSKPHFDLITRAINIRDHVWICANATIAPGITVAEGAVLGLGSVATVHLNAWNIYEGNPAKYMKSREIDGATKSKVIAIG